MAAVNNLHDLTSGYEDSVMDHCTEVCSVGMQCGHAVLYVGLEYSR